MLMGGNSPFAKLPSNKLILAYLSTDRARHTISYVRIDSYLIFEAKQGHVDLSSSTR